jgi:hypothetical protein
MKHKEIAPWAMFGGTYILPNSGDLFLYFLEKTKGLALSQLL